MLIKILLCSATLLRTTTAHNSDARDDTLFNVLVTALLGASCLLSFATIFVARIYTSQHDDALPDLESQFEYLDAYGNHNGELLPLLLTDVIRSGESTYFDPEPSIYDYASDAATLVPSSPGSYGSNSSETFGPDDSDNHESEISENPHDEDNDADDDESEDSLSENPDDKDNQSEISQRDDSAADVDPIEDSQSDASDADDEMDSDEYCYRTLVLSYAGH